MAVNQSNDAIVEAEILHCRYEQLARGVANDFYEPVWKLV